MINNSETPIAGEKIDSEPLLPKLLDVENKWGQEGLPIFQKKDEIKKTFKNNDRVLLVAETGSGKSTASPVLLLEELLTENPTAHIVVSQPRRIATETLAEFVGGKIGENLVGFRHKHKRSTHPDNRITYTVERSLLNDVLEDPELSKYDAVMLDEIHERSIDLDILLPLLKKAQKAREKSGKKLKIVLTSATVNKDKIINYFEDGCAHIEVPGKSFNVKEEFSETNTDPHKVVENAAYKTKEILKTADETTGDILIFMPGKSEIDRTIEQLKTELSTESDLEFIPLLGGENKDNSSELYKKLPGKRRIIVSTNVAETSITIPTVRTVIDSGLMRTTVYDDNSGITELRTIDHTQSNARQRRGRAGRVADGKIYYLFSKSQFEKRDEFLRPEILRTNLRSQVLLMKSLGIDDPNTFDFLDHPGKEKIHQAVISLGFLGALDKNGKITDIGREMMEIEADPHFARMIIEARKRNCSDAVELLVGFMNGRSSIYTGKNRSFSEPTSDFITHLKIWNDYVKNSSTPEKRDAWGLHNQINTKALYYAYKDGKDLFHGTLRRDSTIDLSPESMRNITICVASGIVDQLLTKENNGYALNNSSRNGIQIDRTSVLSGQQPLVFLTGKLRYQETKNQTFASFNSLIDDSILREAAPYIISAEKSYTQPEIRQKENSVSQPDEQASHTPEVTNPIHSSGLNSHEQTQMKNSHNESIPNKIIQKVKELARRFKQSIAIIWEKIKNLFTKKGSKHEH